MRERLYQVEQHRCEVVYRDVKARSKREALEKFKRGEWEIGESQDACDKHYFNEAARLLEWDKP